MSREKSQTQPRRSNSAFRLPNSFAQQVIDLQTEIDISCTQTRITQLMQLYSVSFTQKAIEHYESLSDPRYLHYQERIKNLLIRQDVMNTLSGKLQSPVSIQKRKNQGTKRQRFRSQNLKKKLNPLLDSGKDLEKTINSHFIQSDSTTSKLRESIRCQDNLDSRMEARKRNLSSKPRRAFQEQPSPPVERCDFKQKVVQYQKEIESIIERYGEEKLIKVLEIKKKYQKEAEEIKKVGESEIVQRVLEQMDKQMFQEIQGVSQEMNQKKKEELDRAKSNFSKYVGIYEVLRSGL